jgi:DNA-binding NtrC family response regulator
VDEVKKTILIYSPDLNFCFSLSMLFQDRYNVVTTTNPGMLGKFAADYSPALAVIDAVPSETIITRLGAFKSLDRRLPVIMLYVYNAKDMALDKSIRDHVDAVFYKPFDVALLSKRIEELLAQ